MKVTTKKKILDVFLIAAFLLLFFTPKLNIHAHIVLGIITIAMIVVHLYFNRGWILNSLKRIKKGKFKLNTMVVIAVCLLIVFMIVNISGFLSMNSIGSHGMSFRVTALQSSALRTTIIENITPIGYHPTASALHSLQAMGFHGRPSTASIVHSLSARIMLILLVVHVKMHWSYLTKQARHINKHRAATARCNR